MNCWKLCEQKPYNEVYGKITRELIFKTRVVVRGVPSQTPRIAVLFETGRVSLYVVYIISKDV